MTNIKLKNIAHLKEIRQISQNLYDYINEQIVITLTDGGKVTYEDYFAYICVNFGNVHHNHHVKHASVSATAYQLLTSNVEKFKSSKVKDFF